MPIANFSRCYIAKRTFTKFSAFSTRSLAEKACVRTGLAHVMGDPLTDCSCSVAIERRAARNKLALRIFGGLLDSSQSQKNCGSSTRWRFFNLIFCACVKVTCVTGLIRLELYLYYSLYVYLLMCCAEGAQTLTTDDKSWGPDDPYSYTKQGRT